MRTKFIIILLLSVCFIVSGCSLKNDNKNGDEKSIMISEEKIKSISKGEKIVIENFRNNNEVKKTILDKNEIGEILNILSHGVEENGVVTSESCNWKFLIYDDNDSLISTVWIWESGHFGFKNDKEYRFHTGDTKILKEIIEK